MEMYGMTGEKLGTIGQVSEQSTELPQWKKSFLKKPSISTRKGVAWGYSPPYEDTSTLVLTSPEAVFVDIRFPLRPDASRPLGSEPSFWAFSGTSRTTFDPDTSGVSMPYSAHTVWKHEIDSKGPGITDQGDMFLLPNDDSIEVGTMENPQTNRVELYKEYWTSPPGSGGALRRAPCVVARTLGLGADGAVQHFGDGSGVVIRVGDYCQGIVQQGEPEVSGSRPEVLVERWLRIPAQGISALSDTPGPGERNTAGDWTKDGRSNTATEELSMPCLWACADNRKLGDEIVIRGTTWAVVEVTL